MKKRKVIKNLLIIFILLLSIAGIISIGINVEAEDYGNTYGGYEESKARSCSGSECGEWEWMLQSYGLRLSLYRFSTGYDMTGESLGDLLDPGDMKLKNRLTWLGSADYCHNGSCSWPNELSNFAYGRPGKIAYTNEIDESRLNISRTKLYWTKNATTVPVNEHRFNWIVNGKYDWTALEADIVNFFKFNGSAGEIIEQLKEEFGENGANSLVMDLEENNTTLSQLYITVEPTLRIFNNKTGLRYYGTSYELNRLFALNEESKEVSIGKAFPVLTEYIGYELPNLIRADGMKGIPDGNKVVGKYGNLTAYVTLIDENNPIIRYRSGNSDCNTDNECGGYKNIVSERAERYRRVTSKEGWGINVFWFGTTYTPTKPTCDPKVECCDPNGCERPTPTCTITTSDDVNYTLKLNNVEDESQFEWGISNVKGKKTTPNKQYKAKDDDTMIYGAIYEKGGASIATCEAKRTPTVKTCEQTCTGKSGDSLLACAENFCQANSKNNSEKKECVDTCTDDPDIVKKFTACPSLNDIDGKDTECSADTEATNKTCSTATTRSYYKTECTEESTISYKTDLPKLLAKGKGFQYTPTLEGSKECTMTFEKEKWEYDYACAYTSSERRRLLDILKNFQDISDSSIWAKDLGDKYQYYSSDADIEITVQNGNGTTTKKLEADTTVNLLKKNIVVSGGGSKTINLYATGGQSGKETVFSEIETNSSNRTAYRLPAVCIEKGNGNVYEPNRYGRCNKTDDGPYYEYFTDLNLANGKYDTKVNVNKGSSNLAVANTCHYVVNNDPNGQLSCTIEELSDNHFRLVIDNKNGENISYGISTKKGEINYQTELTTTLSKYTVYGTLKQGDTVVANCDKSVDHIKKCDPAVECCEEPCPSTCDPDTDPNNCCPPGDPKCDPDDTDPKTCSALFKSTQYAEIKEYCTYNWMKDTANYSSYYDCYNNCSYVRNSCKNNDNFTCYDEEAVKAYCEDKSNLEAMGYKDTATCRNDCLCIIPECEKGPCLPTCTNPPCLPEDEKKKDDNCVGIACNYLYRPISLKDPFPKNRMPGYNWYAKEIYITDDTANPLIDSEKGKPEYVIDLTPGRINTIKADTKRYNNTKVNGDIKPNAYVDYVYADENKKDGKYKSKFINVDDTTSGGFKSYFSTLPSDDD